MITILIFFRAEAEDKKETNKEEQRRQGHTLFRDFYDELDRLRSNGIVLTRKSYKYLEVIEKAGDFLLILRKNNPENTLIFVFILHLAMFFFREFILKDSYKKFLEFCCLVLQNFDSIKIDNRTENAIFVVIVNFFGESIFSVLFPAIYEKQELSPFMKRFDFFELVSDEGKELQTLFINLCNEFGYDLEIEMEDTNLLDQFFKQPPQDREYLRLLSFLRVTLFELKDLLASQQLMKENNKSRVYSALLLAFSRVHFWTSLESPKCNYKFSFQQQIAGQISDERRFVREQIGRRQRHISIEDFWLQFKELFFTSFFIKNQDLVIILESLNLAISEKKIHQVSAIIQKICALDPESVENCQLFLDIIRSKDLWLKVCDNFFKNFLTYFGEIFISLIPSMLKQSIIRCHPSQIYVCFVADYFLNPIYMFQNHIYNYDKSLFITIDEVYEFIKKVQTSDFKFSAEQKSSCGRVYPLFCFFLPFLEQSTISISDPLLKILCKLVDQFFNGTSFCDLYYKSTGIFQLFSCLQFCKIDQIKPLVGLFNFVEHEKKEHVSEILLAMTAALSSKKDDNLIPFFLYSVLAYALNNNLC